MKREAMILVGAMMMACSSSSSAPASGETGGAANGGSSAAGSGGTDSGPGGSSAGGSTGSNGKNVACSTQGGMTCWLLPLLGTTAAVQQMSCVADYGGTVIDACPSTGLVGCCTKLMNNPGAESCYYSGVASDYMSGCDSNSWFTTVQ